MIDDILEYWFGDGDPNDPEQLRFWLWFGGGKRIDTEIRERFEPWIIKAATGQLEDWKTSARGRMAWTLLLDQFTRNVYRNSPRTYGFDPLALQSTREAIAMGQDREMPLIHRGFFYLPLEHSEEQPAQDESLAQYRALYEEAKGHPLENAMQEMLGYAERHARVVRRFGRYPHRNTILSRASTDEETAFLASDAAPF